LNYMENKEPIKKWVKEGKTPSHSLSELITIFQYVLDHYGDLDVWLVDDEPVTVDVIEVDMPNVGPKKVALLLTGYH
jgi:hypothetical protein